MKSERVDELINKSIDGLITEEEKSELDGYLKADHELSENYKQMLKAAKLLNGLPNYKVSPNLKKNILNTVENAEHGAAMKRAKSNSKNLFLFRHPKIIIGFTFGVAACVCVFMFWNDFNNTPVNKDSITGHMGKTEMNEMPFDTREIYSAELLGIESSLSILKNKDTLYISMNKKTSDTISIGYRFNPAHVSFIEVRESVSTTPGVKSQDGIVSVTVSEPSKIFAVFRIVKPSSEMDIQVRDSERQIFRYKFNTDKEKIRI